ncbi:MAG: peptidylprolyl isomerase [Coriobacteriia bacterium]|nr:peptidylprolyl isomerase [Coriobacteriia bacterium]
MRTIRGIAALLLAALVVGALAGCSSDADTIARVNGIDIERAELDAIYDQLRAQAGGELDEATALAYKQQIVQMMVESTLITEEAEKLGADLSEEAVTERLSSLMGGADEAAIQEQVEAAGLDIDDVRKSVRDQLANEFLRVEASAEGTMTSVPATFSLLSHILVDDEALATELVEKLRGGEDFAALAAANSTDPGSATAGGSLGWAQTSDYVAEFAIAAEALEVGEISDPVQSQFGWHVILKQDEVAEGAAIADVPEELASLLSASSGDLALQQYIAKLRESADIEYLDETLKPVE